MEKWNSGSESWVLLKRRKGYQTFEVAYFSKAKYVDNEVSFVYWLPHILRKRNTIIFLVKSIVWKNTHNYVVDILRNFAYVYEINKKNGNTFWNDAIWKELHSFGIVLRRWRRVNICCLIISLRQEVFYVSMIFESKASCSLDSHNPKTPFHFTYADFFVKREYQDCSQICRIEKA